MLDESKTNISSSVILFCDLDEVMYPMFYRDRRKKSLVFHSLFLGEEWIPNQQTIV